MEFFFITLRNRTALVLKYKMITAYNNFLIIYSTWDSVCNNILNFRVIFLVWKTTLFSLINNSVRHRMRIMFFKTSCKTEHFVFSMITKGNYFCNLWSSIGKSTCLIKNNSISVCNSFKKASALYRNVVIVTFTHCR